MATLRMGRNAMGRDAAILRTLMVGLALCLAWLQVSPAYASTVVLQREYARQAAWKAAHRPKPSLPPGLTQTPDAALRAKIDAREAADKKRAAAKPAADVRPLTAAEMGVRFGSRALPQPRVLRHPALAEELP